MWFFGKSSKLLGRPTCLQTVQPYLKMLQLRRSLRTLEEIIHVTAECVCLTSSLLRSRARFGLQGQQLTMFALLYSLPVCFPLHWSGHLLWSQQHSSLATFWGHQPTQNAMQQPNRDNREVALPFVVCTHLHTIYYGFEIFLLIRQLSPSDMSNFT